MDILTSYWMLLPIPAASGSTDLFKFRSWVILLVAALVALWWIKWSVHCSCVSAGAAFDGEPVGRLNWDPLALCRGVHGAIIGWCGRGEEDDNEKKWQALRNR